MTKDNYALLDTDFISKTHRIRKDDQNKMIDRIMEIRGYRFYCHNQIRIEIERHKIDHAHEWLNEKISDGSIHCTFDEEILNELDIIFPHSAEAMYATMLKSGCDAYRKGYFEENFTQLNALTAQDYLTISRESFLQALKADCDKMGEGKNLGELLSYVLFQMLSAKLNEPIYIFCSDDKNARNGIVSLGGARCISVLSAFLRLNREGILSREDAEPYIQTYLDHCKTHGQTTFKVHGAGKQDLILRVPCEQIIEEMYAGKLELLLNGDLRYKADT